MTDETLSTPIVDIITNPFTAPWDTALENMPETQTTYETAAQAPNETAPSDIPHTTDFNARLRTFERGLIDEALLTQKNHQGKAADYLGLTYHQFRGLLRKHGLKK